VTTKRRGRHRGAVLAGVVVVILAVVGLAVVALAVMLNGSSDERVARPDSGASRSTSSTATTVPPTTNPPLIAPVLPPAGANVPGTAEWYQAPAPDGRLVTLGVYRPVRRPTGTVLVLSGADGLRRQYEDLAARLAASDDLIAVVGCWFDKSAPRAPDAIDCPNGPSWKGMNAVSVADVDALVAATRDVPGVAAHALAVVGHSAGGGVALLRAGLEPTTEPVVSSSGLLARTPRDTSPTDLYPIDYAATIRVPVFVIHSTGDPICPVEQAQAFAAALASAGNPPKTLYLDAPANHAFPFQGEACADQPGISLSDRYVHEVVAWITALGSLEWPTTASSP
jgi:dienelactone hydrolase